MKQDRQPCSWRLYTLDAVQIVSPPRSSYSDRHHVLGRALYSTVSDLWCLYSRLHSHCNFAQVEAAVQRERGGQEAEAAESAPRGECRLPPPAAPMNPSSTALMSRPPGLPLVADPQFFRITMLPFCPRLLKRFIRCVCVFSAARRLLSGAALGLSELG